MELMVKAHPGQRVHSHMVDAIVAEELAKQRAEWKKEEARRDAARRAEARALRMRLAVSQAKKERLLNDLMEKSGKAYAPPRKRPVTDALWGLYGLAILLAAAVIEGAERVAEATRALRRRLGKRRRRKSKR